MRPTARTISLATPHRRPCYAALELIDTPEHWRAPFLDRVADACRVKHLALRTEQAYVVWVKRFILFHNKRHPKDIGAAEVRAFLAHCGWPIQSVQVWLGDAGWPDQSVRDWSDGGAAR